jgi:DNA-binding protein HU-beta
MESFMAKAKMTKTQLAAALAEATGTNRKIAKQFLETLGEIAYRETKKNGEFTIPGIGKLVKKQRKARMGRNPMTGEPMKIPAKTVVKFRIAKAAKEAILGKK